jgi:hypothetical protein
VGVENAMVALVGPSGNFSTRSFDAEGGYFELSVSVFGNYTLFVVAPVGLRLVATLPGFLDGNPTGLVDSDGSIVDIRLQSASFAFFIYFCMSDAPTMEPTRVADAPTTEPTRVPDAPTAATATIADYFTGSDTTTIAVWTAIGAALFAAACAVMRHTRKRSLPGYESAHLDSPSVSLTRSTA